MSDDIKETIQTIADDCAALGDSDTLHTIAMYIFRRAVAIDARLKGEIQLALDCEAIAEDTFSS